MPLAKRPDPEPLETDDFAIVAGGTALWLLALIVLAVLKATGSGVRGWWLVMCAEGALLGLIGVRYCWRRRGGTARDRS